MCAGVNNTIFKSLNEDFWAFDLQREYVERFMLDSNYIEKIGLSRYIIEGIMAPHGKAGLYPILSQLAFIELKIRELQPRQRDHAVHAIWTYLLGLFLNKNYYKNVQIGQHILQWKLASLFHDIAYPIEISKWGLIEPFAKQVNDIKAMFQSNHKIRFTIVPIGFERLNNNVNALNLINNRLKEWDIKVDAITEFHSMIKNGILDHGVLSALTLLNLIDAMYQRYNPNRLHEDLFIPDTNISVNQTYFERDIVSASSAIFIHNLQDHSFNKSKIAIDRAPITFLLKISDLLQEWDRPSLENPTGYPPSEFDIEIQDEIIFKSELPNDGKEKLRNKLDSFLVNSGVNILEKS